MSGPAFRVPCSHLTREGRPCRSWAMRGTDPPACSSHVGASASQPAGEQACSSHLKAHAGAPAKEQACSSHRHASGRGEAGVYSRVMTEEELADLVRYAGDLTLDDEIALARLVLRRVLALLDTEFTPNTLDYVRVVREALNAARTVARLLRDNRALSGKAADGISGAIAQALDELGTQWGLPL